MEFLLFACEGDALRGITAGDDPETWGGRRETHPDRQAAIQSARDGGWDVLLRVNADRDYRLIWTRDEDEEA